MEYREAKLGQEYPVLSDDERHRFVKELIALEDVAVCIYRGVIAGHDTIQQMQGDNHLWKWKWPGLYFMDIKKKLHNPEPEFREFVHDVVKRLSLMDKKETPVKE